MDINTSVCASMQILVLAWVLGNSDHLLDSLWDAATAVDSFKLLDKAKNMLDGWWHGLVCGRSRESAPMCGTRVGTVFSPRMRQHAPEEHPRPSPRFAARFGRDLRSWITSNVILHDILRRISSFVHPSPYRYCWHAFKT